MNYFVRAKSHLGFISLKVIVLLKCLMFCTIITVSASSTYTFEAVKGRRNTNVTATYPTAIAIRCGRMCSQYPWCHVYNFHPADHICQLCSFDPGTETLVTEDEGWEMYYKRASPSMCLQGWTRFQNSCYLVEEVPKYRQEAQDGCTQRQPTAHLAYIKSMEEFTFIKNLLNGSNIDQGQWSGVWVGAMYLETLETFQWSDGTEVQLELWAVNEPNGNGEACVLAWESYAFKLVDTTCSSNMTSLCQYDLL